MTEIDILSDLVKFNTIKDKENKQILDYIENYKIYLHVKGGYVYQCNLLF